MVLLTLTATLVQAAWNQSDSPITISATVVDQQGNPIKDATVTSSELRYTIAADVNGTFSLQTTLEDVLVIKAEGYESRIIRLFSEGFEGGRVTLTQLPAFMGENNKLHTMYGSMDQRRSTGSYSIVKGEALESNPTLTLMNSLGGRLNGLFQLQNTNVPGFTNHNTYVRGNWGDYITIVDGVERDVTYLEPEVIESVQLLKDATLKSLYGGLQTNGILLITTRKGSPHENGVRINVQQGIEAPTRLPQFLNSYDYARMYNQALANDGMAPLYDEYALNAYRTGSSPYLYPDVDFFDEFLNNYINITRVNAQVSGGNEAVRFFTHLGYQTNGGLEKYSSYPNTDDIFTIRSSVDTELNSFITLNAGFNGALQTKKWPNVSTQNYFSALTTNRPNDFPILIPGHMVGDMEREHVFGGTSERTNNPYGLVTENGYTNRRHYFVQSDFGLDVDLDDWVKGLRVKPFVTFDIYNHVNVSQDASYAVYEPLASVSPVTGNDTLVFAQFGQTTRSTSQSRTGADVQRNYAFNLTTTYNRTFGSHDVSGLLVYYQSEKQLRNIHENPRRQNLGMHVSYMNNNKYIAEVNLNRVGVTSFSKENRYGYFPAFGLGWIISDEGFMSEVSALDYLKLRASYGILGSTTYTSTGGFATRLYQDVWSSKGTIGLDGDNYLVSMDRTGNPGVTFQKSYEFNVGMEAQLLDRALWVTAGYFNNVTGDIISTLSNITPGVSGLNESLKWNNYNKFGLKGVEAEVTYHAKLGDLLLNLGANTTYGITNRIRFATPGYPAGFEGLTTEGTPVDAILGYRAIGTFTDQGDINSSPRQIFGVVRPGDIKYADTNNDGIIDERDRVVIGNSNPRLQFGVSLNLTYKGFNLDVLGIGYGLYDRLTATSYYQISGNTKYSQVVVDGLPNGNPHPQLSVVHGDNNFVNSDYWVVSGSYFKLRNVELGYTLPRDVTRLARINSVKFFVRGFNLLTISKIKDLDPESLDAGMGNFPLTSTFTGGISVSF